MATRLHSNRIELGTITTSQRDALSGIQAGTLAYVTGVGIQIYNGTFWQTWVSIT
jgi:hypothetical protein|tara:strand:- start:78 stop:242 length:165 start_codon:yes stop_codon:yes gene_type:complete